MKISLLILLTFLHSAWAGVPKELNLASAEKLASLVRKCGEAKGWKLSVAIVNSEGNLILFQRGDGTYVGSIESSIEKARSSNAFQRPTRAFEDGVKGGRPGMVTVTNVVALPGGVPIVSGKVHLGAIGVSGAKADEDEECALKALE